MIFNVGFSNISDLIGHLFVMFFVLFFQYQQQVTIFIVGFSDISGQKLRLLQQVNEVCSQQYS